MIALLRRLQSDDQGTFGVLDTPTGFRAVTAELPWRDNRSNRSCIPAGTYEARWTYSPRFGRFMYILLDTSPREGIRIHPGNLAGDAGKGWRTHFLGCIGLGSRFGLLAGQRAILSSAPTVLQFERHMEHKPFELRVQ